MTTVVHDSVSMRLSFPNCSFPDSISIVEFSESSRTDINRNHVILPILFVDHHGVCCIVCDNQEVLVIQHVYDCCILGNNSLQRRALKVVHYKVIRIWIIDKQFQWNKSVFLLFLARGIFFTRKRKISLR